MYIFTMSYTYSHYMLTFGVPEYVSDYMLAFALPRSVSQYTYTLYMLCSLTTCAQYADV